MSRCPICKTPGGYHVDIGADGKPCNVFDGTRCPNTHADLSCDACTGTFIGTGRRVHHSYGGGGVITERTA